MLHVFCNDIFLWKLLLFISVLLNLHLIVLFWKQSDFSAPLMLTDVSILCGGCSPDGPSHGNPPGHPPGHAPGPGPNPTGLGVHASIIHHGNTTTSNAASPQEPTYVNL